MLLFGKKHYCEDFQINHNCFPGIFTSSCIIFVTLCGIWGVLWWSEHLPNTQFSLLISSLSCPSYSHLPLILVVLCGSLLSVPFLIHGQNVGARCFPSKSLRESYVEHRVSQKDLKGHHGFNSKALQYFCFVEVIIVSSLYRKLLEVGRPGPAQCSPIFLKDVSRNSNKEYTFHSQVQFQTFGASLHCHSPQGKWLGNRPGDSPHPWILCLGRKSKGVSRTPSSFVLVFPSALRETQMILGKRKST